MVAIARLLSAPEMVHHLDAHVISQERAKQQLAVALYAHYLGNRYRRCPESGGSSLGRQHRILLGPSGVGKTHLVTCAARLLGVPVAFVSAPSLVETGYVGMPVEGAIAALVEAAGGDATLAESGIVFLDEFDKLKRARDIGRDVSGEGVQNGLLTLLDGRRVAVRSRDRDVVVDTSRVLFLATGAFEGLPAIVRDRLARQGQKRGGLGFAATPAERHAESDAELMREVLPDDLIRFGFLRELIGRFNGVITLDPLTRSDLRRVLDEAPHSPLALKSRMFALHEVRLLLEEDGRDALVERATARGLGARMLQTVVNESLAGLEYRITTLASAGIGAVRYTRESIEGLSEPELIPVQAAGTPEVTGITAEQLRSEAFAGVEPPVQERPERRSRQRLAADRAAHEATNGHDPGTPSDPPSLFDPEDLDW